MLVSSLVTAQSGTTTWKAKTTATTWAASRQPILTGKSSRRCISRTEHPRFRTAEVADNDYAVGELVQAISNSPIWTSTAIFVLEDDSQDGPDHVDAHRSTAYVISPWISQSSIDHQFHNTTGMLKTMEMLLGLKPLTSYDSTANPIMDWNSQAANNAPYSAILPASSIICSQTPAVESLASSDPMRRVIQEAGKLDVEHPDSAPEGKFNELIWKSVKGANSEPPASRFTMSTPDRDDD
jgi:hypothetical protein